MAHLKIFLPLTMAQLLTSTMLFIMYAYDVDVVVCFTVDCRQ